MPNDLDPTQPSADDPVEALRAELEALKSERAAEAARVERLEGELATARRGSGPNYPQTAEGWNYALQVAALRAEANPELQPALGHLHGQYHQWLQEINERTARSQRDVGRIEAALAQLGVEPGTKEHKVAVLALQAGASFEEVEQAYLKTLQTVRVKEAGDRAKDKQVAAASRTTIEGGRSRPGPPSDAVETPGPSPDEQFMSSLQDMLKARAPSSTKFRAAPAAP